VSVIRWEEPPKKHGNASASRPSKYSAAAEALRARPGEWAVVAEDMRSGSAGSLANRIRTGAGPFGPAKQFEAKSVGPVGGSVRVYARYVGDGAP
jgi:hypothetical protein